MSKIDIMDILIKYSKDNNTLPRSTKDLSPLEMWLINKVITLENNLSEQEVRLRKNY